MADDLATLRRNVERFPDAVTAKLRSIAWRTSRDVKETARRLAPRSQDGSGNPHLADSIVITEEAEKKQFLVSPETPWQPNLGLWIERGTVKMRARPFMRPAGDSVEAPYRRDMEAGALAVANEVLG